MYHAINCLTLSEWTTIVGVIVGLGMLMVALCTLIKSLKEFKLQGKQRRAEKFLDLKSQLEKEGKFSRITNALLDHPDTLNNISQTDKRDILSFYELVAFMMNSELISREVIHYYFGYCAIKILDSDEFWSNMDKNEKFHPYWALFKEFVEEMKRQDIIHLQKVSNEPGKLNSRLRF